MLNSKNVKNHMGMIGMGSEILIKHPLCARPPGGVVGAERGGSPVFALMAAQPEREMDKCTGPYHSLQPATLLCRGSPRGTHTGVCAGRAAGRK